MKRVRTHSEEDGSDVKQEERASSQRRTSGSKSVDALLSVARQDESLVTLLDSKGNAEPEAGEDNSGQSSQSNVETALSKKVATHSPSPSPRSSASQEGASPWGFVVYRTTYDNNEEWRDFREKLDEIIDDQRDSIQSEQANPRGATLRFIEDEPLLNDASSRQIRLLFNPNYVPPADSGEEEDDTCDDDPPASRDDGLCEEACLMIDKASLRSVINHSQEIPGYVIAIDALSEKSDQWTAKVGTEDELVRCEYDGTIKVHVEYFLTELYLRSLKDGVLAMGEIHGKPDKVWSGVDFGDDLVSE